MAWPKGENMSLAIVIGACEGDLYKVSRHVVKALYPSQVSEIKRELIVLVSPQQSGVAKKESIDVIFHQPSNDYVIS